MSDLLISLPNEILEMIFLSDQLSVRDLYTLKKLNSKIEYIINDWYFWWKKSVKKGSTITAEKFRRRLSLTVPDEKDTIECIYKSDKVLPKDLYEEITEEIDVDDDFYVPTISYLMRHLKLAVAHGRERSIKDSLDMIQVLEVGEIDITDVLILAARRGDWAFTFIIDTVEEDGYIISERKAIITAIQEEINERVPDFDIIRCLLQLEFIGNLSLNDIFKVSDKHIEVLISNKTRKLEDLLKEIRLSISES